MMAQGEAQATTIGELGERLSRIENIEQQRVGATKALRTVWLLIGSLMTAAAIGFFTWVFTIQQTINDQGSRIERLIERLGDHVARGGPQGHPDSAITQTQLNRQQIGQTNDRVSSIDARLTIVENRARTEENRNARRRR